VIWLDGPIRNAIYIHPAKCLLQSMRDGSEFAIPSLFDQLTKSGVGVEKLAHRKMVEKTLQ
jgi:hypothetical protein